MTRDDVRLAELPSIYLAVVRRQVSRADLSAAVREGCGRAWAFARRNNLTAGRNIAVYWNGAILLEAGVELPEPFTEGDGIIRSATPAGLVVCVTHVGPYQSLGLAHVAIQEWCEAQGRKLAGPHWEIYGHWEAEWNTDPSGIRTEVFYQVA